MSYNNFGHLVRVTTWGESHGPAPGCVIDGCLPRLLPSSGTHIRPWLDQCRAGQFRLTTQRQEHPAHVGIPAVAVGNAMLACVLADRLLRDRAQDFGASTCSVTP